MTDRATQFSKVTKTIDPMTRSALYEGLTVMQIALVFETKDTVVKRAIGRKVKPVGTRNGYPTYRLKEVAPLLVQPSAEELEDMLRQMHPNDLPKMLSKDFWNGQRAKQAYLLDEGDLWPTAKVIEEVGELMKLVKMSVQLAGDAVERQIELTEKQRSIIKSQMDGLLQDLYLRIKERFSELPKETDDEEI